MKVCLLFRIVHFRIQLELTFLSKLNMKTVFIVLQIVFIWKAEMSNLEKSEN
jgi:hypothetical protein